MKWCVHRPAVQPHFNSHDHCCIGQKYVLRSNFISKRSSEHSHSIAAQKNKATSYHLGQLKAKLAKLRRELLGPSGGGGGGGGLGFDVARTGIASVGFVGFPSVGKVRKICSQNMKEFPLLIHTYSPR